MSSGEAVLIMGPMFAGKTRTMLEHIGALEHGGMTCAVVKPRVDTRAGADTLISMHDGNTHEATIACDELMDAAGMLESVDVVGVDEGQFFPDLAEFLCWALGAHKRVFVAALSGDTHRCGFVPVERAVPVATRVEHLTAVCAHCKRHTAAYTERADNDNHGAAPKVDIGGAEKYRAVCAACCVFDAPSQKKEHVV